ncbi:MAG: hypothetical protein ABI689_17010 [Thermoanaerobaculia bacterium]
MPLRIQNSIFRQGALAAGLSALFFFAGASMPSLASAQMLSVGGAVEVYEPADQGGPIGDPTSNQYFGGVLAVGDFNGDGIDDLAIGIPEDLGGPLAGRRPGAGSVALIYGQPGSTLAIVNAWYLGQPWSGADPNVQEAGDHFGCALAAGDFNGDFVDDLAVGVCNESLGGASEAGAVSIFYGVFGGALSTPDQTLTEATPRAGFHFGQALATGDINHDGYDELVAGTISDPQGVFVFYYGSSPGLPGVGSVIANPAHPGFAAGANCAIGDFNGDGYSDFVYGGSYSGGTAGDAIVFRGSAAGLDLSVSLLLNQETLVNDAVDGGSEVGDRFADALLATDLNHDGYVDLVVGAPGEDVGAEGSEFIDAGAAYVILGSPSGLDRPSATYWTENSMAVQTVIADGDGFGTDFAAGDSDHDGYQELAIGSPFKTVSGQTQAGLVILLWGSASGPTDVGVARVWSQDSPGVPDYSEPGDHFGRVLAFGDFNDDLHLDLAIASPDEDDGAGHVNLGVLTVLKGCLFCDGFEAGSFAAPSPVHWTSFVP